MTRYLLLCCGPTIDYILKHPPLGLCAGGSLAGWLALVAPSLMTTMTASALKNSRRRQRQQQQVRFVSSFHLYLCVRPPRSHSRGQSGHGANERGDRGDRHRQWHVQPHTLYTSKTASVSQQPPLHSIHTYSRTRAGEVSAEIALIVPSLSRSRVRCGREINNNNCAEAQSKESSSGGPR